MKPDLFDIVRAERFPKGSYAIFGSGPLAIRWIRDASDVDIIMTGPAFEEWAKRPGWRRGTNARGDEYLKKGGMELWMNWVPGRWDVGELIAGAEEIDGLPFVRLSEVIRWKKESWRDKDIRDLTLIDRYLHPPQGKPVLIFDGYCRFCRMWIGAWRRTVGDRVAYAAYQDVGDHYPEIPHDRFHRSVQLLMPDGRVLEGAHAVFASLATVPEKRGLLWMYDHVPLFAPASEFFYRFVAGRRSFAFRATRLIWGRTVEPPTFALSRWVFLRALGAIFLIAFFSLFVQLAGLIGENGILPARNFLSAVRAAMGPERLWFFPTLGWLAAGDVAIQSYAVLGIVASLFVVAGVAVWPSLLACYALYLSLYHLGQDFLSFQWDILLLEMGFLALFFAPKNLWPGIRRETRPSNVVRWLYWLLLFRFMFNSGLVKLLSGDPTWRDLTALSYHYLTQPLPNPLSWTWFHLPLWFHKAETLLTFFFELIVPFLIFMPRRIRFAGALLMIGFQAFLQLTGNYTFFNLQAAALALLLFDDAFYARFFRKKTVEQAVRLKPATGPRAARLATAGMLVLTIVLSVLLLAAVIMGRGRPSGVMLAFYRLFSPFHIVNNYGPFAVMTTSRDEIVIEGSSDATSWKPYEFRYKPGDPSRPPPLVAPHQPRLDWQMWFAALGESRQSPWFSNLMVRLLQGSPDVLAFFEKNPFPTSPPRFVRAERYSYSFTTPAERAETGDWWKRERVGAFFPAVSIDDFLRAAAIDERAGR